MLTYSRMVLSNPLSPFLVIFCNVVRTLHAEDLCLLRKVSDGMSRLGDMSEHVSNVHRIFATLVGLCEPLIPKQTACQEASRKATNSERPLSGSRPTTETPPEKHRDILSCHGSNQPTYPELYTESLEQTASFPCSGDSADLKFMDMWPEDSVQGNSDQGGDVFVGNQTCDDDIMWQILRSQPSIDWYKATI